MVGNLLLYVKQRAGFTRKTTLSTQEMRKGMTQKYVEVTITHCYGIPYTREQLNAIEKEGGEVLKALERKVQEITRSEDLSKISGRPRVEFKATHTQICFDYKTPPPLPPKASETRFVKGGFFVDQCSTI